MNDSFFARCLLALTLLGVGSCSSGDRAPIGEPPRSPATLTVTTDFDPEQYAAFARAGLAPPRTGTAAGSGPVDIDRARIAAAFATPRAFDRDERTRTTADGEDAPARFPAPGSAAPAETSRGLAGLAGSLHDAPLMEELSLDSAEKSEEDGGRAPTDSLPRKLTPRAMTPRMGKLLYHGEGGTLVSMKPRALRLVVHIDGHRARTVVDTVFENPAPRQLEGTFFYSLPTGASPAGFGMFRGSAPVDRISVGDGLLPMVGSGALSTLLADAAGHGASAIDWKDLQEARVVGQQRARQVYEEIVRENIDPALLEWTGGNTFRARVFPIEASSVKRVLLAYEETLPRDGDQLVYGYPIPDDSDLGAVEVVILSRGKAAQVLSPGQAVAVSGPREGSGWIRHEQRIAAKGGVLNVTTQARGRHDVILGDAAPLPGFAFSTRIQPEIADVEDPRPTRQALFVLDTSASGEGAWQGLAAKMLIEILARDATIEEYAVLLFDVRTRWLHEEGWRTNDATRRAETHAELDRIYVEGATSFESVLTELSARAWVGTPQVFLLSDGEITWGNDQVPALLRGRDVTRTLRWNCYRFGELAANLELFDGLAASSGGRTIHVLSDAEVSAAALAHRKLPVTLLDVDVLGGTAADLVVSGSPRLLFPGQTLEIAGRLTGGDAASVRVRVGIGTERSEQSFSLARPEGADEEMFGRSPLAGRAWGELQVRHLLALDDPRLDRMITALSQAYGLANRAASLLVLDAAADYERYDLAAEQVDLRSLDVLRAQEEDRRRDALLGLSLDGISEVGRLVLEAARQGDLGLRGMVPIPSLDLPLVGGEERLASEVAYRSARSEDGLNVKAYMAVAQARALNGDTTGAIRALSCLVEKRSHDAEAARLVGFACLALGQYREACDLFERIRINRQFEPQTYIEEALALEAAGRYAEAFRNYEIVLARQFPRHTSECQSVAKCQYTRLLRAALAHGAGAAITARLAALDSSGGPQALDDRTDLQVVMHWNSDSVDIDLWLFEPEGAHVFYSNKTSPAGGELYWDTTNGHGPELYHRRGRARGRFEIAVDYYGNNSARWHVPTAVLLVVDRSPFTAEGLYTRDFRMCLLPDARSALSLRQLDL